MKVGGNGPGIGQVGSHRSMIDEIMEAQKSPIERAEKQRDRAIEERNDYSSLGGLLDGLRSAMGQLATPGQFNRFKADSSHPDILDAVVTGVVNPGNFEFEVKALAEADKHLAFGFADIDVSPVGFGYMAIEKADGQLIDINIEPGATLKDVAQTINQASGDFHAQIVNTGFPDEPFRLLVASTKTGEAAALHIDEDTTFLDFKNIKKGRDLDVMFEDVKVTGAQNKLDKLLDGLSIDLKKAEPGTKINLNIAPDVDQSVAGIKKFTDGYNQILAFATGAGENSSGEKSKLSTSDSSVRTVIRQLQTSMSSSIEKGGRFSSMAQIGISTNAKTGLLEVDENKLKKALNSNYRDVMELFSHTDQGDGIANKMSAALTNIMDPTHGPIKARNQSLKHEIESRDQEIARQTDRMEKNRARIERQFAALESNMGAMNQQSQFLTARFGTSPAESATNNPGKKATA